MPNSLQQFSLQATLKRLRNLKGLTQDEVALKMKLPRSSYAQKESKGDFSEVEFEKLARILGSSKEELMNLPVTKGKEKLEDLHASIPNWQEFIVGRMLRMEAIEKVLLMSYAEIIAASRGEAVTKVYSELQEAVASELRQLYNELR